MRGVRLQVATSSEEESSRNNQEFTSINQRWIANTTNRFKTLLEENPNEEVTRTNMVENLGHSSILRDRVEQGEGAFTVTSEARAWDCSSASWDDFGTSCFLLFCEGERSGY